MTKIIMIFIDGLGLGQNSSKFNPLVAANTPGLNRILGGFDLTKEIGNHNSEIATLIPTDASLGVDGLPQSATGQTAIFTGVNAAQKLGRHISGFPTPTLQKIIKEESIFKKINKMGLKTHFINTYTNDYFEKTRYHSATTLAAMAGGVRFNNVENLLSGESLYHDLTQQILINKGYDLPKVTPRESASRLVNATKEYDFILFEYFRSDIVGHKQDLEESIQVIEDLDEFLLNLFKRLDWNTTLLVLTSDHGNIEDISSKTHTKNRVPTILIGDFKEEIRKSIFDLTDLAPMIVDSFKSM
ncbi:alkaline phosphatase family protein [Selenihalanaerobacter shriftii]|uniref:Phosphoglycerate mutase n=1 Tax=Selenihalanaerobacter shriftii TaxID=142842 RepID=A0A1T4L2A6_9FIRM|nr:alkaline phosphatase family protein [Selenihalanaerobacter shriftii]SJZ48836.1 phosphoglycerate mutase [Selenihalanaerobacter shriftii]